MGSTSAHPIQTAARSVAAPSQTPSRARHGLASAGLQRTVKPRLVQAAPNLRPTGEALDIDTQVRFGALFRHDFSGVRIHADPSAATTARAINANAYTVGRHIFFGCGRYQPSSPAGQRLLAHELAHVVQQSRGGPDPGIAHERDAEAAATAADRGSGVTVRARSAVGIAAQPAGRRLGESISERSDLDIADLPVVTYGKIEEEVDRAIRSPGFAATQGRSDFNSDPALARANLYSTHFRDAHERLSYALGVFRVYLGMGDAPASEEDLRRALVSYETQIQRRSNLVIHSHSTMEEAAQVGALRDRLELEQFQAEVARIKRENAELQAKYSRGIGPADLYQTYIGGPVEEGIREAVEATPAAFSLFLDFVPIVGQLKAVAEAIVGQDLITGRELADWERGLNLLLALLPEAKGVFRLGAKGITELANVAAKSTRPAEEIYRTVKVASRLSEADVEAAKAFASGAGGSAREFERVATALEEMGGEAAPAISKPVAQEAKTAVVAAGERVSNVAEIVELSGVNHTLGVRRVGGRLRIWLCSNECGDLVAKATAILERLPAKHEARGALAGFIERTERRLARINDVADAELLDKELSADLARIEKRYPGAFDPNVTAAPAGTTPPATSGASPTAPGPGPVPPEVEPDVEGSFVEEPTAQPGHRSSPRLARPPSNAASEAARARFKSLQPGYAQQLAVGPGGQVHHAIELQTLDRYPGAFGEAELNDLSNMRGVPAEQAARRQLHNSAIRRMWDRHYDTLDRQLASRGLAPGNPGYNGFVRQYLSAARDEIDHVVGQFFSEQRRAVFSTATQAQ
jgi:hypothetical protein